MKPILNINFFCWVLVAHAYNPSYLEGKDQEDCGLRPAGQIVHETPSPK
jgi:hypothetical protein